MLARIIYTFYYGRISYFKINSLVKSSNYFSFPESVLRVIFVTFGLSYLLTVMDSKLRNSFYKAYISLNVFYKSIVIDSLFVKNNLI